MISKRIPPPEADEYAPFYSGYVALVRERDPMGVLKRQVHVLRSTCAGMTDAEALTRYAAGKWSIKQMVGHLSDSERVFAYRLLRIGRGDPTPLPGFDENLFVAEGDFERRSIRSLLQEFETVRAGTLRLVESLPPEAWTRRGVANSAETTSRAILFVLAGHVEHHFGILRERYGLAVPNVES